MTDPEHERRLEVIAEARRVRAQFLATLEGERMNTEIRAFCLATGQRVVRSAAASLVGLLVAGGTGLLDTDWQSDLSVAGMAGVVTLLLCLAGGATNGAGPAFGSGEVTSPPAEDIEH